MLVDVPLDQFLHGWSRAATIPRCQRIMPKIDVVRLASSRAAVAHQSG
jgi:hypothetical protein